MGRTDGRDLRYRYRMRNPWWSTAARKSNSRQQSVLPVSPYALESNAHLSCGALPSRGVMVGY